MFRSNTAIPTPNASLYLKKLCKHFQHKIEAPYTDTEGTACFPMGTGVFVASDTQLNIACSADTREALEKVQWIIDDHLIRFARKEGLQWRWIAFAMD